MTNDFDTAIAGDARLMARWAAVKEKVTADAVAAGLGPFDTDELKDLPGVKLAVFTDMGLPADLLNEVKRIPTVAARLRNLELSRQLNEGDSEMHERISALNPHQRLEVGRKIEAARRAQNQGQQSAQLSMEEEARAINLISKMPPAQRITAARAAGLIR